MEDEKSELLDDPTGGPSAGTESHVGDSDEAVDPSAGAEGQGEDEGAVEEATESTEDEKPAPG